MPPKSRAAGAKKVRRKERKNVAHGVAHIKSTFNNTIVTITDPSGAVIAWLEVLPSQMRILVHQLPVREQIDTQVQEQLIVELYSK